MELEYTKEMARNEHTKNILVWWKEKLKWWVEVEYDVRAIIFSIQSFNSSTIIIKSVSHDVRGELARQHYYDQICWVKKGICVCKINIQIFRFQFNLAVRALQNTKYSANFSLLAIKFNIKLCRLFSQTSAS